MFVEATVVLVRNESHIRVLRALRIVLLLDSVYLTGVRRFVITNELLYACTL